LQRYVCIVIFACVSKFQPDNAAAVRALAHPLRLRLLDLLRFEGPSTATLLAARLVVSTGATSYHLRQLARFGYIEDADGGRGRERRWRYRERSVVLVGGADDPTGRRLVAEVLAREAHAFDGFLARGAESAQWDDAVFLRAKALRLTATELEELRRGLDALLSSLRAADTLDAPEDARAVRVLTLAYPFPSEDS